MRVNAHVSLVAIERLLESYPELADDATLRIGMIEGETEAIALLNALVAAIRTDETLAKAIGDRVDAITERKRRAVERAKAARDTALEIMEACQVDRLTLPEATLSVRPTPPAVIIDREDSLPEDLFRIKREPDKTAIKDRLAAGQPVPGAHLSNGGRCLALRTN